MKDSRISDRIERENKRRALNKERRAEMRAAGKAFLESQGLSPSAVDALETYLAGDEGDLCAVPDIEPNGLLNDLATRPFPVLTYSFITRTCRFTERGLEYFGVKKDNS